MSSIALFMFLLVLGVLLLVSGWIVKGQIRIILIAVGIIIVILGGYGVFTGLVK